MAGDDGDDDDDDDYDGQVTGRATSLRNSHPESEVCDWKCIATIQRRDK